MGRDRILVPERLKKNATIGIVSPAGNLTSKGLYKSGIRILHELGFRTKFPSELWPGQHYLADTDENRIKEFQELWHDHEVDCLMAARGGYGSLRIASSIDYKVMKDKPKILIGFSDITLLHLSINNHANLVTLHGPVVTSLPLLHHESIKNFKDIAHSDLKKWQFRGEIEILRGGRDLSGVTTGGNLSTLVSALGTPIMSSWDNKIVFLEDTSEPVYRVDRMLTQLKLSGYLDGAAAIILGDFSHGLGLDRSASLTHHERIWERVLELTSETTPVWGNYPMGHGKINTAVPLGMKVTLNNSEKTLLAAL